MKRSLHCTYPRSLHTENKHIRKWTILLTYIIRWITAARVCQCAHHHHYHRLFVRKMKQTFRALILCIASNTFFFIIMPQNSRNSTEKPTITNLLSAQGADDCMFHNGTFPVATFLLVPGQSFSFCPRVKDTTNNKHYKLTLAISLYGICCFVWVSVRRARVSSGTHLSLSCTLHTKSSMIIWMQGMDAIAALAAHERQSRTRANHSFTRKLSCIFMILLAHRKQRASGDQIESEYIICPFPCRRNCTIVLLSSCWPTTDHCALNVKKKYVDVNDQLYLYCDLY